MQKNTHAVMSSSLAKALIAAGVKHYDAGSTVSGGIGGLLTPQSQFVVATPTINQQDFKPEIGTLQQQQGNIYQSQQNLGNALLNRSNGLGPNPAIERLNNETGNNVAQTGSLIASSRGASANPGLIARIAAQQGAGIQQTAAGQEAALEAQQQAEAQKELEGLYGAEAGTNTTLQGINQGANTAQNSVMSLGQLGAGGINAQTASGNASSAAGTTAGILGGFASALGQFVKGSGGAPSTPTVPSTPASDLPGSGSPGDFNPDNGGSLPSSFGGGSSSSGIEGGSFQEENEGGVINYSSEGGDVPGKANVAGDSPKNDTVPALVSPGEEVLPRSVTMAPDAPERAKKFVEALQEKQGEGKGYGKVLKARATLKDRVERLEKMCAGGRA